MIKVLHKSMVSQVNLNAIPWDSVSCLTRVDWFIKLLATTLVPIAAVVLLALAMLLYTFIKYRDNMADDYLATRAKQQRESRLLFARGVIFTAFLIYPSVSSRVLSM